MFATAIALCRPEPVNPRTTFTLEEDERIMCFIADSELADAPCPRKYVREALYELFLSRNSRRSYAEVICRAAQLGSEKCRDEALAAFPAFAAQPGESAASSHERFKHAQFLLRRYFGKQRANWVPSPARKRKSKTDQADNEDEVTLSSVSSPPKKKTQL